MKQSAIETSQVRSIGNDDDDHDSIETTITCCDTIFLKATHEYYVVAWRRGRRQQKARSKLQLPARQARGRTPARAFARCYYNLFCGDASIATTVVTMNLPMSHRGSRRRYDEYGE